MTRMEQQGMLREHVAKLLGHHVPWDAQEVEHLETMRLHLKNLKEPCSRHQPGAHFTSSALVLSANLERICLVHHAKVGRWLQPGGHMEDSDSSPQAAAIREVREETGLTVALHPASPVPFDVDVHAFPERPSQPAHQHLDLRFLLVAQGSEALSHDPQESHGVQWWTWDQARRLAEDASLGRLLEKASAFFEH